MKVQEIAMQSRLGLNQVRFGKDKKAEETQKPAEKLPSILDQLPVDQTAEKLAETATDFVIDEVVGGKGKLAKRALDQLPLFRKMLKQGNPKPAAEEDPSKPEAAPKPTQLDVVESVYNKIKQDAAELTGKAIEYVAIPVDVALNPQDKQADKKKNVKRGDRVKNVPQKVQDDVGGLFGKLKRYADDVVRLANPEYNGGPEKPAKKDKNDTPEK